MSRPSARDQQLAGSRMRSPRRRSPGPLRHPLSRTRTSARHLERRRSQLQTLAHFRARKPIPQPRKRQDQHSPQRENSQTQPRRTDPPRKPAEGRTGTGSATRQDPANRSALGPRRPRRDTGMAAAGAEAAKAQSPEAAEAQSTQASASAVGNSSGSFGSCCTATAEYSIY